MKVTRVRKSNSIRERPFAAGTIKYPIISPTINLVEIINKPSYRVINFRPSNLRSNSRLIIIPIFIPRDTGCHRFRAAFKTITLSFRSIRRRIKDSTGFEIWDANGRKNWTREASGERKPVLHRRRKFLARMLDRDMNRAPSPIIRSFDRIRSLDPNFSRYKAQPYGLVSGSGDENSLPCKWNR